MMGNKIMVQLFKQANGGQSKELESGAIERHTYDADQYERALEEKFNEETFQKNREIKRLQDAIAAKDQSITSMRDKLAATVQSNTDEIRADYAPDKEIADEAFIKKHNE